MNPVPLTAIHDPMLPSFLRNCGRPIHTTISCVRTVYVFNQAKYRTKQHPLRKYDLCFLTLEVLLGSGRWYLSHTPGCLDSG